MRRKHRRLATRERNYRRRERKRKAQREAVKVSKTKGLKVIQAPFHLDISEAGNRNETLKYIRVLKENCIRKPVPVELRFDRTSQASASATLLLYSHVDRAVQQGNRNITMSYPSSHKIEQVLQQVGLCKLLGMSERVSPAVFRDDVGFWRYSNEVVREDILNMTAVYQFLDGVFKGTDEVVPAEVAKAVGTMAQEMLGNSVEHAYIDLKTGKGLFPAYDNKWWAFAGIKNGTLNCLICDLGVGIPRSLPLINDDIVMRFLRKVLGSPLESDESRIEAATLVGETRTKLENRGRGYGDLRKIIDQGNAAMIVTSNKGMYKVYKDRRELIALDRSIGGTVVELSMRLVPEVDKGDE